jgi:shikimate kinase
MAEHRRAFLLGLPGAGKSTLGRAAAEMLRLPFADLDEAVAEAAGKSVAQIFLEEGEASFRTQERRALESLLARMPHGLIALGGGTPCQPGAMAYLNAHGLTVFLDVPAQIVAERLLPVRGLRPLLAAVPPEGMLAYVEDLAARRRPFYAQAALTLPYPHTAGSLATALLQAGAFVS